MKDWKAAGDTIRRRTTAVLYESLRVEAPFSFSPVLSESETGSFLENNWEDLGGQHYHVLPLPGRDVSYVTDTLISICKFLHVVECARANKLRGALTWAVVDSYHACLLGSRALCALHGVLSYGLRGRTVLVDFRPDFGTPDNIRAFKRAWGRVEDPIAVIQPISRQLEQKDSWLLLKRITDMVPASDPNKEALAAVGELAKQSLSHTRNVVLYDSVAWVWRQDLRLFNDLTIYDPDLSIGDVGVDATLSALDQIIKLTRILVKDFCLAIGFSVDGLANIGGE